MAGTLEEIVSALAARRQRLGRSQSAVARQMGTTQSAVSEIETLQVIPRIATLQRYAEACGGTVRVELDLPDISDEAAEIAGGGFNDHAYLAIYDRGIGWAGLDQDRAHEFARNTGSVVVRLPVVGDYRPTADADRDLWNLLGELKPGFCCQDAYISSRKGNAELHTSGCPRRCSTPVPAERGPVPFYPCALTVEHDGAHWLHPDYRENGADHAQA